MGLKIMDYRINSLAHWHIGKLTNLLIFTFAHLLIIFCIFAD